MRPPNKLLVNFGLPKTGTTYLGNILKTSHKISVSKVKEPRFFINKKPNANSINKKIILEGNYNRGHEWYLSLFDNSSSLFVDQSTLYWLNSKSFEECISDRYELYPYIICRNPFEQIKSYIAHLRRGYLPNRPLNEICKSDPEFKKYIVSIYDFSKTTEKHRGVIDGVLYLDFDLLITDTQQIIDLISNYTMVDIQVKPSVNLATKDKQISENKRGHPKFYIVNSILTSVFAKKIGALIPSFMYVPLITLRKRLIRFNLKSGDSQWAVSDFDYLKELLNHETN